VTVGWTCTVHTTSASHACTACQASLVRVGHAIPALSLYLSSHSTDIPQPQALSQLAQPVPSLQSCGTCKEVLQHCSQLCQENSQQRAGVLFLKHNIWNDFDDLTDVARMYKAKAVPSFIFLTGGAMVDSHSLPSALHSCSAATVCAHILQSCSYSHSAVHCNFLHLPPHDLLLSLSFLSCCSMLSDVK